MVWAAVWLSQSHSIAAQPTMTGHNLFSTNILWINDCKKRKKKALQVSAAICFIQPAAALRSLWSSYSGGCSWWWWASWRPFREALSKPVPYRPLKSSHTLLRNNKLNACEAKPASKHITWHMERKTPSQATVSQAAWRSFLGVSFRSSLNGNYGGVVDGLHHGSQAATQVVGVADVDFRRVFQDYSVGWTVQNPGKKLTQLHLQWLWKKRRSSRAEPVIHRGRGISSLYSVISYLHRQDTTEEGQ